MANLLQECGRLPILAETKNQSIMKQLQLEQIVGYVPYDLKIANKSIKGEILGIYTCTIDGNKITSIENVLRGVNQIPLLNPIEEIFNIPEIMDEFSETHLILFTNNIHNQPDCALDFLTARQLLLCYKHHIDFQKLIKDKLALNKKEVIL